jgi:hypothetical protein
MAACRDGTTPPSISSQVRDLIAHDRVTFLSTGVTFSVEPVFPEVASSNALLTFSAT